MKKSNKKATTEMNDNPIALLPLKGRDIAVAGLIWQPIHTIRNIQAEAKTLIRNEKCKYFLTHSQGNRAQCGMTRKLPDDKRTWSAVMILAETLGDSWLGLFSLPDGRFWLAAVDNGMVVPGGDSVFDDEVQARERYRDYVDLFSWRHKYFAGIEDIDGEKIDLTALLQTTELKNHCRIIFAQKLAKKAQKYISRGILLLAVIGVAVGGLHYYEYKKEQERLEKIRAEKLAQKKASGIADAWRKKIPAMAMLNSCINTVSQYPIDIVGWQLTDFICDGYIAKVRYKAGDKATSKNLASALAGRTFTFQKGMTAELTEKIITEGNRKAEKLQPVAEVATVILEKLQLGFAKGKIDDILSNNKKTAKFELETQLSPLTVIILKNMDGVVINNVKGRMAGQNALTWSISGEVYGK